MPSKFKIDEKLLATAVKGGKHKSQSEAIDAALQNYVRYQQRLKLLELAGTIEYLPGEDPMSRRRRERAKLPRLKRPRRKIA